MYEFQHGSSFPDNEPQIPLKVENEREMKVVGMLIKQRSTGMHGLSVFISTAHGVGINYLSCMIHYICPLLISYLISFASGQLCPKPLPFAITCLMV